MKQEANCGEDLRGSLFDYELVGAGWATATLRLPPDAETLAFRVSYLNDSLRELASALLALDRSPAELAVCFVEEPGVHRLVMRRPDAERVEVEVWYFGRAIIRWPPPASEPSERLALGSMRWQSFRGCVVSVLQRLWREHGGAGYLALWQAAPFPIDELRALETR